MKKIFTLFFILLISQTTYGQASLYDRLNSRVEYVSYDDDNVYERNISMENGFAFFNQHELIAAVSVSISKEKTDYELYISFIKEEKPFYLKYGDSMKLYTETGKEVSLSQKWKIGTSPQKVDEYYSISGNYSASKTDLLIISEGIVRIELQYRETDNSVPKIMTIESGSPELKWIKKSVESLEKYITENDYIK